VTNPAEYQKRITSQEGIELTRPLKALSAAEKAARTRKRCAAANKAVKTKKRMNAMTLAAEAASKVALREYCEQHGWRIAFLKERLALHELALSTRSHSGSDARTRTCRT
jgi:hypothetical protein